MAVSSPINIDNTCFIGYSLFYYLFDKHTYLDRDFLQHEVVERSEVLRRQIILLSHRVHLEIDHARVAKDDEAEVPTTEHAI